VNAGGAGPVTAMRRFFFLVAMAIGLAPAGPAPAVPMPRTASAVREASPRFSPRLWIDATGAITRAEFAQIIDRKPNHGLRALLIGQKLSAPPPKNMLQPLRIAVQVAPASDQGGPAGQPS